MAHKVEIAAVVPITQGLCVDALIAFEMESASGYG